MNHLLKGFVVLLALSSWATAAQLDLTEKENGKDLWMDRGDLLVFRLPSNPSTGYSWSVAASKPGLLLQQAEATCEIPKFAKGRVGAGGTEVWSFRAERAGMLTLTFSYARVWEKGGPPVRTLSWPVTIRPSAK
ncbi:MAG: protease inhibitor I42 family protein [Verrucomicrobia bacterium]|nr:protease inhibitor I42 family protein [Verrucomicrobiota bacterium]